MTLGIGFVQTTKQKYKNLKEKDPKILYFITDTREIYKGDDPFTDSTIFVEQDPETLEDPLPNYTYIDIKNGNVKLFDDKRWYTICSFFVPFYKSKKYENIIKISFKDSEDDPKLYHIIITDKETDIQFNAYYIAKITKNSDFFVMRAGDTVAGNDINDICKITFVGGSSKTPHIEIKSDNLIKAEIKSKGL